MILNSAPQNEAILSNVGSTGEFRIRASAKAFSILSSGLYQNKIRAIIRELSTNAVDSHVEAGRAATPFDVHLPNALEPWFSVRDYGTGLSHEQVTNIYTTYFESSKTDSNDYVGALGLGSKTPFSYTNNFTVTSIKDGRRGIYTAFIGDNGMPSIALMMEEKTQDLSGLEIKFSVNDRYDFNKFSAEAATVFTYFKLRPVVSGVSSFAVKEVEYETKDIIHNVHARSVGSYGPHQSFAIMGSICYPIDIPKSDTSLGSLRELLECGLEINFDIGELDFQASREGLSYIPATVDAIRRKLTEVSTQFAAHLTKEADAIPNYWDRGAFLSKRASTPLWKNAVIKYATDTKFPLIEVVNGYARAKVFKLSVDDLVAKYNISIDGFSRERRSRVAKTLKVNTSLDAAGQVLRMWEFSVSPFVNFVYNDTKIGAGSRARYHWRAMAMAKDVYSEWVYVLSAADKSVPMKLDELWADLHFPPKVLPASKLSKPIRESHLDGPRVDYLGVYKLSTKRARGRWRDDVVCWDTGVEARNLPAGTYHYVPLERKSIVDFPITDESVLYHRLKKCGIASLTNLNIYGVGRSGLKRIKGLSNWIPLEKHIADAITGVSKTMIDSMAVNVVEKYEWIRNIPELRSQIKSDSPYSLTSEKFSKIQAVSCDIDTLKMLCTKFAKDVTISPETRTQEFRKECDAIYARYPLLSRIDSFRCQSYQHIAQYINLVDEDLGRKALDSKPEIE